MLICHCVGVAFAKVSKCRGCLAKCNDFRRCPAFDRGVLTCVLSKVSPSSTLILGYPFWPNVDSIPGLCCCSKSTDCSQKMWDTVRRREEFSIRRCRDLSLDTLKSDQLTKNSATSPLTLSSLSYSQLPDPPPTSQGQGLEFSPSFGS